MNNTAVAARSACEALALHYLEYADQWRAQDLADLFTVDGVLDRLGNEIVGREAIASFIANRPREFWQRHHGTGFSFALDATGDRATGSLDLHLERGRHGDDTVVDTVRARFHDQYERTDEGWRICRRDVRLITE